MSRIFPSLFLVTFLGLTSACANTSDTTHHSATTMVKEEFIFKPVANLKQVIADKTLNARQQNKLLMIVLGGQWCHDSRGLAQRFSLPEFNQALENKYEIQFVDVGYLESGFELVKQYQLPIYYGTPTVLIIDPVTNELLNKTSHQKWLSADSYELPAYQAYFLNRTFSKADESLAANTHYQQYLAEIDAFEQAQAKRLHQGYMRVGPLLADFKINGTKPSEQFNTEWMEVRQLRMSLVKDVAALVETATNNVNHQSLEPLIFPTYEKFSWE